MKQRFSSTVLCFILASCQLLTACSTPLKQAGQEHAIAISKWNELARYAETRLRDYPIALTAQLALIQQDQNQSYQLKNIQLSKKENSYTINLLDPVFEHKYICNPICKQLLEYVEEAQTQGSTLLNDYFTLHEFELFSFYGELFKMNEKLDSLRKINAAGLSDYLSYISEENKQFQVLSDFVNYLNMNLSEARYQQFLADPQAKAIRKKASQVRGLFKQPESADNHWMFPDQAFSPETQAWQPVISSAKADFSDYPESKQWQKSDFNPRHSKPSNAGQTLNGNWILAKNTDIEVNHYVCSYAENIFGRVRKMSNNNVDVELIGQAKLLQDGILYDLEEGALFNGHDSITFLPLQGTQSFSTLNVAMCEPE
jgi:hypothetical protein